VDCIKVLNDLGTVITPVIQFTVTDILVS